MKSRFNILTLLLSTCLIILFTACQGGGQGGSEVSTQKDVISCQYQGLSEKNGQPIVVLTFVNQTGKNLNGVYGGIRILNASGEVVQRTGFSYGRPFLKDEEKTIPAFEFIPLQEAALAVLRDTAVKNPVRFELSEVIFEDGESQTF